MTVTLELKPELEARVTEQAAAQGVSVETYIQRVLESLVVAPRPAPADERHRMFEEWLMSHSYITAPPLSDDAISRESIYGEREDRQL